MPLALELEVILSLGKVLAAPRAQALLIQFFLSLLIIKDAGWLLPGGGLHEIHRELLVLGHSYEPNVVVALYVFEEAEDKIQRLRALHRVVECRLVIAAIERVGTGMRGFLFERAVFLLDV